MFNKSFVYGALTGVAVVYAYHRFVKPIPSPKA